MPSNKINRKEQEAMLKEALAVQGFIMSERVISTILETNDVVLEKGNTFALKDAGEIQARMNKLYPGTNISGDIIKK